MRRRAISGRGDRDCFKEGYVTITMIIGGCLVLFCCVPGLGACLASGRADRLEQEMEQRRQKGRAA